MVVVYKSVKYIGEKILKNKKIYKYIECRPKQKIVKEKIRNNRIKSPVKIQK